MKIYFQGPSLFFPKRNSGKFGWMNSKSKQRVSLLLEEKERRIFACGECYIARAMLTLESFPLFFFFLRITGLSHLKLSYQQLQPESYKAALHPAFNPVFYFPPFSLQSNRCKREREREINCTFRYVFLFQRPLRYEKRLEHLQQEKFIFLYIYLNIDFDAPSNRFLFLIYTIKTLHFHLPQFEFLWKFMDLDTKSSCNNEN